MGNTDMSVVLECSSRDRPNCPLHQLARSPPSRYLHDKMPSWYAQPNGVMKAAVLTNPGNDAPEECFTYQSNYPRPSLPSPEWVLCRIHASGLNRAELRGRTGAAPFIAEFIVRARV